MRSRAFIAAAAVAIVASLHAAPRAYHVAPEFAAACEKTARLQIGARGVTHVGANLLADTYFQIFLGQCGGAGEVHWVPGGWNAPAIVGIAGGEHGAIHIDRHTGAASYPGYPEYPTLLPKDFLRVFIREYSHQ